MKCFIFNVTIKFCINIGHSSADLVTGETAINNGACMITHLFNAMVSVSTAVIVYLVEPVLYLPEYAFFHHDLLSVSFTSNWCTWDFPVSRGLFTHYLTFSLTSSDMTSFKARESFYTRGCSSTGENGRKPARKVYISIKKSWFPIDYL